MAISEQGLALEEFLTWPEKKPALEYIDGMVTQKVSPNLPHSALQGALVVLFEGFARPRRLARAFPELRTTFERASVVPDVSVYLWDRIPRDQDGRLALDARIPPDIAIEIASPGQRVNALLRRCRLFIERGVAVVVLIDPRHESVIVVRPGSVTAPLCGVQPIDLEDVLPGFQLSVQELFEALR